MNVLFNCTTSRTGGTVQNAVNFILHAHADPGIAWSYAVSAPVQAELERCGFTGKTVVFERRPGKNPEVRRALKRLERETAPDMVFTMAGPTYVRFGAFHVQGCSNPYLTNLDRMALTCERGPVDTARTLLWSLYLGIQVRRADAWLFQTESSRAGFCRRLMLPRARTAVVPNALGASFTQPDPATVPASGAWPRDGGRPLRLLCPSADYPHKALTFLPEMLAAVVAAGEIEPPTVTITVPPDSPTLAKVERRARRLGVAHLIHNHGPFSYWDAQGLYDDHDAVILPSVLEVFSTSYLEAMATQKPLLVPDRAFAQEICGDAPVYFAALDPASAARAVRDIALDPGYRQERAHAGLDVLARYGGYSDRYAGIRRALIDLHARYARAERTAGPNGALERDR
jgi:glycosyltransferase involved in cell wall biosynthesis